VKIVVLDGHVANPGDLVWDPISVLGELAVYPRTNDDQFYDRARGADILIINKFKLTEERLFSLDNLKCVCLLSTGFNNVDIAAALKKGIIVSNAVGYGSQSVAQHVFALILELTNHVGLHNDIVQANGWAESIDWSFTKKPMIELYGKTIGVYG